MLVIAGARQIFHKNFFSFFFIRKTSPGSEKKNFILKNLPGDCNILVDFICDPFPFDHEGLFEGTIAWTELLVSV
jgi:hypothetical protein